MYAADNVKQGSQSCLRDNTTYYTIVQGADISRNVIVLDF